MNYENVFGRKIIIMISYIYLFTLQADCKQLTHKKAFHICHMYICFIVDLAFLNVRGCIFYYLTYCPKVFGYLNEMFLIFLKKVFI